MATDYDVIGPKLGFSSFYDMVKKNATYCNIPPANLNIPIQCVLHHGPTQNISIHSSDMEVYLKYDSCCPTVANYTNVWTHRRDCFPACYTYDVDLAKGMNKCTENVSASLGIDDIGQIVHVYCEYVDYDALRKGESQVGSAEKKGGIGVLGTLVALASLSILVATSL